MSRASSLPVSTFFVGVSIGLAVAAPLGLMAILCIQRTIASGVASGLAIGLAAATVQVTITTIAFLRMDRGAGFDLGEGGPNSCRSGRELSFYGSPSGFFSKSFRSVHLAAGRLGKWLGAMRTH